MHLAFQRFLLGLAVCLCAMGCRRVSGPLENATDDADEKADSESETPEVDTGVDTAPIVDSASLSDTDESPAICAPPVVRDVYIPPGTYCGDGLLNQIEEECDDGNDIQNDSCDHTCRCRKPEI